VIGWLDCTAGASGDMLLGALVDAGVPLAVLQQAVDGLGLPEPVRLTATETTRAGLGALKVDVEADVHPAESTVTRTWGDVRALLEAASLDEPVRRTALDVFARLASAEGAVHRVPAEEVHFHEVGALDALADVVGVAAGVHALGLEELVAGTVSLGSGSTRGAHGPLPVPAPAVLALLAGVPVQAGAAPYELTTPTGAALLAATVTRWGPLPELSVVRTGTGAGGRDPDEVANVLRLVLGERSQATVGTALLLETNVDDLDPRLWPAVLSRLIAVGASDAWLTPILMKKGRPAHTLSVLVPDEAAAAVRRELFCETPTLGLRETRVGKRALARTFAAVQVDGRTIRVKLGWLGGEVVNAMPEWEDVAAASAALGRPGKVVLQQAQAAAAQLYG
jgi:uncharacterized protein (TIGR00299 family) protein